MRLRWDEGFEGGWEERGWRHMDRYWALICLLSILDRLWTRSPRSTCAACLAATQKQSVFYFLRQEPLFWEQTPFCFSVLPFTFLSLSIYQLSLSFFLYFIDFSFLGFVLIYRSISFLSLKVQLQHLKLIKGSIREIFNKHVSSGAWGKHYWPINKPCVFSFFFLQRINQV